jgi:hypothetical protein
MRCGLSSRPRRLRVSLPAGKSKGNDFAAKRRRYPPRPARIGLTPDRPFTRPGPPRTAPGPKVAPRASLKRESRMPVWRAGRWCTGPGGPLAGRKVPWPGEVLHRAAPIREPS